MKFVDLFRKLEIPTAPGGHHHSRPGWVQLNCPFCKSGNWHLGCCLSDGHMNCWRCGHHTLADVLMEYTGQPFREIAKYLEDVQFAKRTEKPHTGKLKLPDGLGDLLPIHKKYLTGRGFDVDQLVALWKLRGIGRLHPSLAWRLFIPIHLNSEVVSWTTRAVGDVDLRYRSAGEDEEAVPHKSLLYGEEYCRHTALAVEGPTDVWTIGPGTTALCGQDHTRAQILRLSRYPRRVICFDNEPQAQRRARKLADNLSAFPGETFNVTLSGKDANSSPPHEIKELRRMFLDD